MAALLAFWLHRTGAVPRLSLGPKLPSLPALWAMLVLYLVAVLCRSSNALALERPWILHPVPVALGEGPDPLGRPPGRPPSSLRWPTRASSAWDGKELIGWLGAYYDEARAGSPISGRRMKTSCWRRPWNAPLSAGRLGGGRGSTTPTGRTSASRTDCGLSPSANAGFSGWSRWASRSCCRRRFVWLYPPRRWSEPAVAPAAAIAVLLALFMIDCLMNAMVNPVYLLGVGGLTGLTGRVARCGTRPGRGPRSAPRRPTP